MSKIIDMHCHIFPEKIAIKAASAIGDFYGAPMRADGTVKQMLKLGSEAGISQFLVCSAATTPDQVPAINNFISESVKQYPDKLIGFGTLHPEMDNPKEEIDRLASLGLKGVKLHPDFQRFKIDDSKAEKLYALLEGRFPMLIHMGDYRNNLSHPKRMAAIADKFPSLKIIAAHFGGWSQTRDALEYLAPKNIYVDSSSSLYLMTPEEGKKLVRQWGADRIFYGADYPMWNFKEEIKRHRDLGLEKDEYDKIFYLNAEKFLAEIERSIY